MFKPQAGLSVWCAGCIRSESWPELADKLDEDRQQALTGLQLPKAHRKKLRTADGLERFSEATARRSRAASLFPNDKACTRPMAAVAMEQSEESLTGRRHIDMSSPEEQRAPPKVPTGTDPKFSLDNGPRDLVL